MNHKIPSIPIPEGKKFVTQRCDCGMVMRRYRDGSRVYQHPDGIFRRAIPNSCPVPLDVRRRESQMRQRQKIRSFREEALDLIGLLIREVHSDAPERQRAIQLLKQYKIKEN